MRRLNGTPTPAELDRLAALALADFRAGRARELLTLRQSCILGGLSKASGRCQGAGGQELRTAQREPTTSLLAPEKGRPLLVGPRWRPLPGFGDGNRSRPAVVLDRFRTPTTTPSYDRRAALRLYSFISRPQRHDPGRIDAQMARVIVMLDVEEVDGVGDARPVVEFAEIAAERGIVPDLPQVTLEVAEIDRIEADQGGGQRAASPPPSAARRTEIAAPRAAPRACPASRTAPGTPPRKPAQARCEAGAIDAVVDGRVDAGVERVDQVLSSARIIVASPPPRRPRRRHD